MMDYLMHHGIKGQKWGVRNGPPYPLNQTAHNKVVKADQSAKYGAKQQPTANAPKQSILKRKDRDYSEREDMKLINPLKGNENCVSCTMAYDLRRRGYDVTAGNDMTDLDIDDFIGMYKNTKLVDPVKLDRQIPFETREKLARHGKNYEYANAMADQMISGGNQRGNLLLQWDEYSGHSVAYEVKNNRLIVRDCQSNEVFEDKAARNMMAAATGIKYYRMDNLTPDVEQMKKNGVIYDRK